MDGYTRFTKVKVDEINIVDSTIAATAKADAAAAAGTAPTKAEYDAVVELVNDLKAKYNALVAALT